MIRLATLQASVRGSSHEQSGQVNQDAVALAHLHPGRATVLAVADGHGSTRSFRSARGSQLAVAAAREVWQRALRRYGAYAPRHQWRAYARNLWPREVVATWKRAVRRDLLLHPFTPLDFAAFPEKPPLALPGGELPFDAYLAYGSTLVVAVLLPRLTIFSQLGDGDVLTLNRTGRVERPWPRRNEYFGNQTASLCSRGASSSFQVRVIPRRKISASMFMLSTDGYANCFGDDAAFFQVAQDFYHYLETLGVAQVRVQMEPWLADSSRHGSGDDITVALAVRQDQVPD